MPYVFLIRGKSFSYCIKSSSSATIKFVCFVYDKNLLVAQKIKQVFIFELWEFHTSCLPSKS